MFPEFFQRYWKFLFVIFALAWYFFGIMAYRVQEDAKKRGMAKAAVTFWSVSVVFFGPIFLPLYYIFRSKAVFAASEEEKTSDRKFTLCPHCGESNPDNRTTCVKCKKPLDASIPTVGTKRCPYCDAENPIDARRCSSCDQTIGYMSEDEDDDE